MKIVTWNCNGAFRKKFTYLINKYEADIYLIQECEDPKTVSSRNTDYHFFSANNLWTGNNKNRGLGVFAKASVSLKRLHWNHLYKGRELQWFLPVNIDNRFNLVAVWNHHNSAKAFPYIGQFWLFLQNNKNLFKNCIIGGDFNSNAIWDSWDCWWNHSDCVKELSDMDILSIYHRLNKVKQGAEAQKTFYLHRNPAKGYHIDYFFADASFLKGSKTILEFGDFSEWNNKSDHVPIVWKF